MVEKYTSIQIKRKYGISSESLKFYVKMGAIHKIENNLYIIDEKIKNIIIDKNTVFKYCFEDSWKNDLKDFKNFIKYTSKVKVYTKEEIEQYEKKLREERDEKKDNSR